MREWELLGRSKVSACWELAAPLAGTILRVVLEREVVHPTVRNMLVVSVAESLPLRACSVMPFSIVVEGEVS